MPTWGCKNSNEDFLNGFPEFYIHSVQAGCIGYAGMRCRDAAHVLNLGKLDRIAVVQVRQISDILASLRYINRYCGVG